MDRNGQMIFFTLMLSVVAIILVLSFAQTLTTMIGGAMNKTHVVGGQGLDCDNNSISKEDKASCFVADMSLPYYVGIVLAIAGAAIGAAIKLG